MLLNNISKLIFLESLLGIGKLAVLRFLDASMVLPLRVRYMITDVLSTAVFLLFVEKRSAVKRNLSFVLQAQPTRRDIWMVFREYGRYWAELPGITDFWRKMPRIYEGDVFPPPEKNFLGLTFHIGNFEIFGHELHNRYNCDFHVVAERLRPRQLADYFMRKRRKYHVNTICHDDARGILRVLKKEGALGIVCDRMISGKGTQTRLFGRPVNMPLNIVSYALDWKIPVYIAYCVKDKGGLKIISSKIDGDQSFETAVGKITSTLECAIRQYPHQWHVLSAI